MNILLLGQSKVNKLITDYFYNKNINITGISDIYELQKLNGEINNFTAQMKENDIRSNYVIFTEPPFAEPAEINGLKTFSLYQENKTAEISEKSSSGSLQPIVFLLDYIGESPFIATIQALYDAAIFARKKYPVYIFSRFIRTSGLRVEDLYREAREAGVNFIKYEKICITVDLINEEFNIDTFDGVINSVIKTTIIYSDGGWDVGKRFSYAIKILNLTPNNLGYITEDNFFLTPALTSRHGVFHITRDLSSGHFPQQLNDTLDYIFLQINTETKKNSSNDHVEINEKKCVLCNNCYRTCPHAALEPDLLINKMKNLNNACRNCGICINICPAKAITSNNDTTVTANCNVTNDKRIILYCKNSGGIGIKDFIFDINSSCKDIEMTELPCGGQITSESILKYLNKHTKILCILCPDDACHHFTGNKRACAAVNRLNNMITSTGLSNGAIIKQISPGMPNILQEEVSVFINNP